MIRDALEQIASLQERIGVVSLERFVLRNGREFKPMAYKGRRMKPKHCFANATQLMWRRGLTYVEGFASRPSIGFPLQHAWAIDAAGNVVDPTWERPAECSYFGVAFTPEQVNATALRTECYGVLTDGFRLNVELMGEMDPDFLTERDLAKRPAPRLGIRA